MEEEKVEIRRIQWVDNIRKVWPEEDLDFTPWLEENLDVLEEALGFEFERDLIQREERTGNSASSLKVDLVGSTDSGKTVVIENQFDSSDHDHLGKVLTYTAVFEADIAIWIMEEPRPEHIRAIEWLNDSGRLAAYMFKVQAFWIDEPNVAAPLLTLIIGPSESSKVIAESKLEMTERERTRKAFYTELLKCAEIKHAEAQIANPHTDINASKNSPYAPFLGRGTRLVYMLRKGTNSVDLWIEGGEKDWNEDVYQQLLLDKDLIERSFGCPLTWENKSQKGRKIKHTLNGGWEADQENWEGIIEEAVGCMIRLEKAIKPYLEKAINLADTVSDSSDQL